MQRYSLHDLLPGVAAVASSLAAVGQKSFERAAAAVVVAAFLQIDMGKRVSFQSTGTTAV